jgi:hypothetical protein
MQYQPRPWYYKKLINKQIIIKNMYHFLYKMIFANNTKHEKKSLKVKQLIVLPLEAPSDRATSNSDSALTWDRCYYFFNSAKNWQTYLRLLLRLLVVSTKLITTLFFRKMPYFRPKFSEIAENCDQIIDPLSK